MDRRERHYCDLWCGLTELRNRLGLEIDSAQLLITIVPLGHRIFEVVVPIFVQQILEMLRPIVGPISIGKVADGTLKTRPIPDPRPQLRFTIDKRQRIAARGAG
jgi:hypothetical protein